MLYFEEIGLQLCSYAKKLIQSFPWAASEGLPPLTLGTPVSVITIWQSSKGQVNGLDYSGPYRTIQDHWTPYRFIGDNSGP